MATAAFNARSEPRSTKRQSTNRNASENSNSRNRSLNLDRQNNLDFSNWKPSGDMFQKKKVKNENPDLNLDKENQLTSTDSTPQKSEHRHRTPSTFPRTKFTSATPLAQRRALENLKRELNFSDMDEMSADGEPNNEKSVPIRRENPPNYTRQEIKEETNVRRAERRTTSESTGTSTQSHDFNTPYQLDDGPDSNQIVGRLMQIRDYLKQANDMVHNLQRAPDTEENQDQLEKLERLVSHLKEQEKGYMNLLQRMLSSRDDVNYLREGSGSGNSGVESIAASTSIDVDLQSDISEATTSEGTGYIETKEELEALRQQHELLKKMLAQQEELRSLQERQSTLLKMQRDAEQRMIDQIDFEGDQGMSGDSHQLDATLTNTQLSARKEELTQSEQSEADTDDTVTDSEIVPQELRELRQKLTILKSRYEAAGHSDTGDQSDAVDPSSADEQASSDLSAISKDRQQLRNKLKELQDKKQRMDQLLLELQSLKEQKSPPEAETASTTSSQGRITASIVATARANGTADDANDILEALDARSKLKKLQEVRSRLNQLRDLVQYYQSGNDFIHGDGEGEGEDQSSLPDMSNYEDPLLMRNLRKMEEMSPYRLVDYEEGEGGEEEEEDEQEGDKVEQDETTSNNNTEDNSSQLSSNLGILRDDPEIQEKLEKLNAAKSKLKRLHELVAMVQQSPDAARNIPDDLAELAASIDDGDTSVTTTQTDDKGQLESSVISDRETARRDQFYEEKMSEQKAELSDLMDERKKLLDIQKQLAKLHDEFPDIDVKTPRDRRIQAEGTATATATATPRPAPLSRTVAPKRADTVTFQEPEYGASNDALWDQMRSQRILREELRQKRQELEELMKKDHNRGQYARNQDNQSDNISYSNKSDPLGMSIVSGDQTMATWGGSTVDNLEDIFEDAGMSGDGDEDDVDDGFPSDGIVQAEEEEEAHDDDDDDDNETYTIEDDYKWTSRQRNLPVVNDGSPSSSRRPQVPPPHYDPQDPRASGRQGSGSAGRFRDYHWSPKSPRHTNPVASSTNAEISGLQQQLEETSQMCQQLLSDQQTLNHALQTTVEDNTKETQTSKLDNLCVPPDSPYRQNVYHNMVHHYAQQTQQQQLLFQLNHCYDQLYQQHTEMQSMHQQLQHLIQMAEQREQEDDDEDDDGEQNDNENDDNMRARREGNPNPYRPWSTASWYNSPYGISPSPYIPTPSPYGFPRAPPPFYPGPSPMYGPPSAPFSFSPQLSMFDHSGPLRDAYQQTERPRDAWQQTEAYMDDGGIPKSRMNAGEPEFPFQFTRNMRHPEQPATNPPTSSIPTLNLQDLMKKAALRQQRIQREVSARSDSSLTKSAVIGRKYPTPSRANAAAKLASRQQPQDDVYRPGISAGISGTGFQDTVSVSSVMSSIPGVGPNISARDRDTQDGIKSTSEMDSDAPGEMSLFEALRETIYSEVATLISQNESRPHFLIELFRELQMLNSDYLRQRALYAVQDLVSRFLTDESGPVTHPPPAWLVNPSTGQTASEQTPSESYITSDDDNIKAHLYALNQKMTSRALKSDCSDASVQTGGSVKSETYDYVENVENQSTMSTPPSTSYWDQPFNQDSLGDTVIHLDKALHRMREYERRLAEQSQGQGDPPGASPATTKEATARADTGSEVTSSSAHDQGSESSVSDLPYPRIDTQQLDRQIKSIMTEVIPLLKEHMEDVCSAQLLAYIQRLVLTLTKQHDDEQEFVRFFHKQLGNILKDSLAKFEGRKLRECGEDLLVDMSEILFNELAFFRLMKDLDDPSTKAAVASQKWTRESQTSTDTNDQEGLNEDGLVEDEESSEEDGKEEEEEEEEEGGTDAVKVDSDIITLNEEEQLGNERDDLLASATNIRDEQAESENGPNSAVKIELAVSETKPFTRIGSDEDEDDEDESISADDPDDTAVSRQAETDKVTEDQITDEVTKVMSPSSSDSHGPNTSQSRESVSTEGENSAETVITVSPDRDNITLSPGRDNKDSDASSPDKVSQMNGDIDEEEGEVAIDDLPQKISLGQNKVNQEAKENSSLAAVIATLDSGECELAGDGSSLPEPPEHNLPLKKESTV